MLIELMRPAGPELARRWLAALLLAPERDRPSIVAEVERRMVALYAEPLTPTEKESSSVESGDDEAPVVHIVSPPVQKQGYVETTERAFSQKPRKAKAKRHKDNDARSA